jgi:BolA protein
MRERIFLKLQRSLNPSFLEVIDESCEHSGHFAMRQTEARETHFRIKIDSSAILANTLLEKHKIIYKLLDQELKKQGVHALAIELV